MFLHKTEFFRGAPGLPACTRSPVIPEQYKVPRETFIAVTSTPGLLFHFLIFHSFLTLSLYPKLSISFSFLKDFPLAPSDHCWPSGLLRVSATKLSLRIISFSVFYSIRLQYIILLKNLKRCKLENKIICNENNIWMYISF